MTDTALAQTQGAAAIAGLAPVVARDYTIAPSLGALTATGVLARLYPQGQTVEPAETSRRYAPKVAMAGAVTATPYSTSIALYDLVDNCLKGAGFVPGGVTVIGFIVKSTDLDTGGSPTVVQSLLLGSTELVTGITTGQGGTYGFYPCTPTATTDPTAVYVKTTTEPDTPATGTMIVTPLYFS